MEQTALPTLKQLQYLVTLAETRHFRKAAEKLKITQPSLSVQLKTLEETLGITLAERGRGGVLLTPAGREVADMARRVLADVLAITDATSAGQDGLSGTLRLGAPPTLGPYLLPGVIKRLHQHNPDLRLYIREATPLILQDDLARGEHDLIVSPLPVGSSDLVVNRLFREPLYLVCAKDHPLARKKEVLPKDLYGAEVLTLGAQHYLHDQVRRLIDDFGAEWLRDYDGTSLDTLRLMVGSGLGITFLPAMYVKSEIGARGEVAAKTVRGARMERTIGAVWRKTAAETQGFLDFSTTVQAAVRAHFKDVTVL